MKTRLIEAISSQAEALEHVAERDLETWAEQLPAGTSLPARVRAYVIADVFPLAVREITGS